MVSEEDFLSCPIISLWKLFDAMTTRVPIQSAQKSNAIFLPTCWCFTWLKWKMDEEWMTDHCHTIKTLFEPNVSELKSKDQELIQTDSKPCLYQLYSLQNVLHSIQIGYCKIPWHFPDILAKNHFSLTQHKIPWQFPDLEKNQISLTFPWRIWTLKLCLANLISKDPHLVLKCTSSSTFSSFSLNR